MQDVKSWEQIVYKENSNVSLNYVMLKNNKMLILNLYMFSK